MRKLIFAVTAAALSVPTVTTFSAAPAYAQSGYYTGKVWRDSRGRQRCRKKIGTSGLLVGAAGGASPKAWKERASGSITSNAAPTAPWAAPCSTAAARPRWAGSSAIAC